MSQIYKNGTEFVRPLT